MKTLAILLLGILTTLYSTENPELVINITNIEKVKGEIKIGVFNSDQNFLKEGAAIKNYSIKVTDKTASIKITNLPKGEYAISMYHDENSDNECNKNFIGIPKEAYGFSNNIKPVTSAPKFKDCKFLFSDDKTLNIKLLNF
jgi:uncharacterized protein (DUF2141 family)